MKSRETWTRWHPSGHSGARLSTSLQNGRVDARHAIWVVRSRTTRHPAAARCTATSVRGAVGVEPTLDQEAGRATVLKTVERLFSRAPGWPRRVPLSSSLGVPCSWLGHAGLPFLPVWQQIWQQVRERTRPCPNSRPLRYVAAIGPSYQSACGSTVISAHMRTP